MAADRRRPAPASGGSRWFRPMRRSLSSHPVLAVAVAVGCVSALGAWLYYAVAHGPGFCRAPDGFATVYCGRTLMAARSESNPALFAVVAVGGRDVHAAPDSFIVQSFLDLSRRVSISPYIERIVALLQRYDRRSVLLLGLGGGALPLLATTRIGGCRLTAVDISADSLEITRRFVLADDGVAIRYVHANADDFLRAEPDARYDAVVEDMYDELSLPGFVYDRNYMRDVHRVLDDDGVFISNIFLTAGHEDRVRRSVATVPDVFGDYGTIGPDSNGNVILVASKVDRNLGRLGAGSAVPNPDRRNEASPRTEL